MSNNQTFINNYINRHLNSKVYIYPLATFRILFGLLMAFGTLRTWSSGWIEKLYLEPDFFFKYYAFHWVPAPNETGIYIVFALLFLSALGIAFGLFYRASSLVFLLCFSYKELIDASNYLNHYYLVILFAFLLIFLPAHRFCSLDVAWRNVPKTHTIPSIYINVLIAQLCIVYTSAGIAKLNADWLMYAMPLRIWLPNHADLPVLGYFLKQDWCAYVFSWSGAIYDLTIAYFLLWQKTRPFAYLLVLVFHFFTYLLFNIGLFPLIMVTSTLIFFSGEWHGRIYRFVFPSMMEDKDLNESNLKKDKKNIPRFSFSMNHFHRWRGLGGGKNGFSSKVLKLAPSRGGNLINEINLLKPWKTTFFSLFLFFQVLLPFRHLYYDSDVIWSEEGYRFAWRVMLVEKSGHATFTVTNPETGDKAEIINSQYLTTFQEKQMSIQPDFILQFAHLIAEDYRIYHGIKNPIVTVASFVAINGRASKRFVNPNVNLAKINDNFSPKTWLLAYKR